MLNLSIIQGITEHCIRLLSYTENLRRDELTKEAHEYAEQLFPSLRKLFIASMMHTKQLICISGLQGAGKTTLMKNFYGISGELMNISLGRGERVPVLITEGNVTTPHITAITIRKDENDNYTEMEVSLLHEDEIIRATKGEDPTIMYLEITVPYKHTHNSGVSFMLLPGFEKKNEYWNNLIEFSVNSSDAAVFVFNETSFSNADNEDYLNRIEKKFGDNVVYVITGSDNSLDNNAQVKNTCIDVLKIKQPDRVVCVGQYNDNAKNDEWIAAFKSAIDKYAIYETQARHKNDLYIYEELKGLKDTLYKILGVLSNGDTFEESDYRNHSLLKAFDQAVLKKRKELARYIDGQFTMAKSISVNSIAEQLDAQPWYKNLKRTFFGPNIREQYIETRKIIDSSLKKGAVCLPELYLGKALEQSLQAIDSSTSPNALQLLVDTSEDDNGKRVLLESEDTTAAINDVCALIQVPHKNAERSPIQTDNTKRLLKAVAEVITYYYSLQSYEDLTNKTTGLAYYEPARSLLTGKDVVAGAESSKKLAVGLAGVMGIDILGDGSLNLISQIAATCGVSLTTASLAAFVLMGAGVVVAVKKDLNRMQRADFDSARMVVCDIYDNIQREALERFDIFTNEVRERIEDNLADLGGDRRVIMTNYNAKVEVNFLLDWLNDILKDYLSESHDIKSYFSR